MKPHCLLVACVGLLLGGCRSTEDMCRHARDVSIRMLRAEYASARRTIAEYEHDRYDAQLVRHVANIEAKFVDVCMAAAPPTRVCLEKVDELDAAEREHREKTDACNLLDDACWTPSRKARDEKLGDCKQPMDELADLLFEGVAEPR